MRPVLLFSLTLLVASAFAFDIGAYLSANESNATITKEFFTINKTVYYLVNISGQPSFLVKTEEPILEQAEIEAVLKEYYKGKYALNSSDTSALKSYFLSYNASRNDGKKFPGQEEAACRKAIFLHMYPCIDDTTCNKTARLVCAAYADAIGCDNPNIVLQPVKDFSYSSDGTDALMADIFDKLDGMNADNTVSYIDQIKKDIPLLNTYKTKMEGTIFRIPSTGQTCKTCFGICPDIDFDDSALSKAESLVNNLSVKIGPLSGSGQLAAAIYNNTQYRLMENANANLRLYYLNMYNPLNTQARAVKLEVRNALALVSNDSVQAKLSQLEALEAEINGSINANNFSDLNATLMDYSQLILLLNSSGEPLVAIYNNVSAKYEEATVYLFMVEGEALSAEDLSRLNVISQKKIQLDQQFKAGLTATQYADIQAQYESIISEEKSLVGNVRGSNSLYIFTGMSNKFVDAADVLLAQTRPLTYSERQQFSSNLPLGVSVMLFLSFSSMIVFLFLLYYALSHRPMSRIVLVVLSMFLVFLVGLVSIGIFLSLNRSLSDLTYDDFVDMVKYSKTATIAVQKNGADAATLAAMGSCASDISNTLSNDGVKATIYEMNGQACTVNGTEAQNCLDTNSEPLLVMNASLIESAHYSGLLIKQADLTGDKLYYQTCPFADSLRLSWGG